MKNASISYLSIAGIILFGSSCAAILGIKEPEVVSKQESYDYLVNHNLDTTNVLFLKRAYFDTLSTQSFKPNWEVGFRPIQCKLFYSKGNLVFQYASCEGSLESTKYAFQFPPENIFAIDSSHHLTNEITMISNPNLIKNTDKNVLIIYWAEFTGVPGRRFLQKMTEYGRNHENLVDVYKLNVDMINE